jgi:hypothetical protein
MHNPDPAADIDLARYPADRPGGAEYAALMARPRHVGIFSFVEEPAGQRRRNEVPACAWRATLSCAKNLTAFRSGDR